MAEFGTYALISSLVNLVANLLPEAPLSSPSDQALDACGVEADLKRLMRMLERIKAVLCDAEQRTIRDQSVRLWLKELRKLGLEAEYLLEEYMYEVYQAQVRGRNSSELDHIKEEVDVSNVYSVQIPYDMLDRIRDIKSRFEEIAEDREALCLHEEDAPRRCPSERHYIPTSPLVVEHSVFGREDEKVKIIDSLFLDYHRGEVISVLPIVGKGGIGKTTMAQLVYNDKLMQDLFDLIGWVYVSNDFNIERITQDIIESFTGTHCYLKSPTALLEKLANRVGGKRVFLVLDDVWNEDRSLWESLRIPLMLAKKATILVTTRNISVARIMQTMDPLQLEYLSDDKCWLLFTHYAFQGIDPASQYKLVEIGKKIVEKCSGLPLAVKSIASLLSHERELHSWMEILHSDFWELDVGNEVLAPLQISYDYLPTYLKPCLLLCSMFPKDHEYSMNLMTRLWIAHGYIEPNGRKQIEEIAIDYAKMLYERSFFDDYNIKCDLYGLPSDATFRLHDMVHDLAWLNSEKTCCSVERSKQPFISKKVCHLHLHVHKELSELPDFLCSINIQFMQTLVMRHYSWPRPIHRKGEDKKHFSSNALLTLEHLRALDLSCEEVLPFFLGNLKHLRYFSLGHEEFVSQVPMQCIFSCYGLRILILDIKHIHMKLEGIGNLVNLEFLQLSMSLIELPASLGWLKKLRVLEIHEHTGYRRKNFLLPECIGNLVELHRIVIISRHLQELPKSLCKLTNLKKLILQKCILKKLPENFGNLTSLQFLFLGELHYFPLSSTKLLPWCTMNICNLITQPDNNNGAVGWLKEFNDLKGTLMIQDIRNITSIEDAKNADLISKRNLETLSLLWNKIDYVKSIWSERLHKTLCFWEAFLSECQLPQDFSAEEGIMGISIDYSKNCNALSEQDLNILEIFQPHPNLKHLDISSYRGLEFPTWMGDPLSCASLVKLWIRSCCHISSLPLGKVLSLKELYIDDCGKLLHLNRESLPSKLQHLTICDCNSLVEVELFELLAKLKVRACNRLKSLSTVHLKMSEAASESSVFSRDCYHFKPSEKLMSFPSLKELTITECPNLVIGLNQLVLAEDCEVDICDCKNLRDWCNKHNFKHKSDDNLKQSRKWPLYD